MPPSDIWWTSPITDWCAGCCLAALSRTLGTRCGTAGVSPGSGCNRPSLAHPGCERIVLGKGAKVLIRRSAQGSCLPHGRRKWRPGEWKGRWERRWKAKSRRESRRESKQPHHERMRMGWNEVRDTHQTWANVNVTLKCVLWNMRKCDVWGVLFTPPVGCSRLLSAVNDLTTTSLKKNVKVSLWAA